MSVGGQKKRKMVNSTAMVQSEGTSVFRLRFGVLCNSRTNLWLVSKYWKVASRDTPIRDILISGCRRALFLSFKGDPWHKSYVRVVADCSWYYFIQWFRGKI